MPYAAPTKVPIAKTKPDVEELLAVVVHAANIQSLPRATTRGSGRRQAGVGQTVGPVD